MTEAVKPLHSRSKAQWWNKPRSLQDIAEHLELAFKDEQNLETRLTELIEENSRLAQELAQLKKQTFGQGRHEAQLAVRERLLKDEFERRMQELQLERKKERLQYIESVEQLKQELEGCFCRQGEQRVVHVNKRTDPKVLRIPNRASIR